MHKDNVGMCATLVGIGSLCQAALPWQGPNSLPALAGSILPVLHAGYRGVSHAPSSAIRELPVISEFLSVGL